jgi:GATA-binding protein, other eukaryote
MAGGGGEEELEVAPGYVLSLPAAALLLPVAVSCLDATVRRKRRSRPRLRAQPSGWWAFKLPVPAPEEAKGPVLPASVVNNPSEEARPQSLCVRQAPSPDPYTPAAAEERPVKSVRMCLQCGAVVTPQWRSGPMGQGTLCNACGVRLKVAGALRGQVRHRPAPRTAARPPPDSPASESSPDSPIWEPGSVPDVYLVRKRPLKQGRPPPPSPMPAPPPPAPAVYLVKKKKRKKTPASVASAKKPWWPPKSAKQCLHCGSSSTPQWREGPLGRSTLCNACGVRYRQGRLLPEYRPLASPTFEPSEHANRHSQVLQLHRQRRGGSQSQRAQSHHHHQQQHPLPVEKHPPRPTDALQFPQRWHVKEEYPPTPPHQPLPHPVVAGNLTAGEMHVGGMVDAAADADAEAGHGGGNGNGLSNAPSSLDSLLLEGPSAPLLVDDDDPLID